MGEGDAGSFDEEVDMADLFVDCWSDVRFLLNFTGVDAGLGCAKALDFDASSPSCRAAAISA